MPASPSWLLVSCAIVPKPEPVQADDLTQETFLVLIRGVLRYDARQARFATYLYGVVRSLATRRLRGERRFVILSGVEAERGRASEPSSEHVMVEAAMRRRAIGLVRRAILTLPKPYREAVVLCDLHDRDYAAAAARLGCAIGTVRSRVHRGRALLRRKLSGPQLGLPDRGLDT